MIASCPQQRVERLAEAQLVLALGLHAHAAGAGAHQHRGVVGRELPVDRGAVEGALDAHAEQQVGGLGAEIVRRSATKHSIVAKCGEIIPAPLHCAFRRTRPRRQLHLEVGTLLEGVRRLDRRWNCASPSRLSSARACRMPLSIASTGR